MLRQRILTALVLTPIAIAVILFLPTSIVGVVIAVMCLQAVWEWTHLAGIKAPAWRLGFVILTALLLALAWIIRDQSASWIVVGAGLLWWLASLLWLRNFSYAAAPTRENAAIKMLVCLVAIVPAWLALMKLHDGAIHGPAWALFAVALIWVADIGAYFAGRRFGTTKLAPRISPNKTTAGAWGALAGAAVVSLACGWLFGWRDGALLALIALSLLAVAASIVGDLFESLLKRQADVKDSGTLFPGHGGLLDRLDSLFAALPVFLAGKALIDLAFAP